MKCRLEGFAKQIDLKAFSFRRGALAFHSEDRAIAPCRASSLEEEKLNIVES